MTDPIHNVAASTLVSGGSVGILTALRSAALAAGWLVDEWDTAPTLSSDAGGPELYLRTQVSGLSQQAYFSLKALLGNSGVDHSGLLLFANTSYSNVKRVDNQPGLFARSNNAPLNGVSPVQVFSGLWDDVGANAYPADHGRYQTAAFPTVGSTPLIDSATPHLNAPLSTSIDKLWIFYDQVVSGGSRTLTAIWYVGNQMYAFSIGKVHYDSQGVSPQDVDGHLIALWHHKYDDRSSLLLPRNNSLAGSRSSVSAVDAPLALVRNATKGSTTWPAATPTGATLLGVGTVVLNNGKLEASDGAVVLDGAASLRPDQSFDSLIANFSDVRFPNPRLSVHREEFGTQHRCAFARARGIARFPDGGPFTDLTKIYGDGVVDWSDAGYYLPWYFACTAGVPEGSIITNGTRQYMVFPGNRGGVDPYASHRLAGLAFRIA